MIKRLQGILLIFILILTCIECTTATQVEFKIPTIIPQVTSSGDSSTGENQFQRDDSSGTVKFPKWILAGGSDPTSLMLIDLNGKVITTIETPGLVFSSPDTVHVIGQVSPRELQIPLVYQAFDPQPALMVSSAGSITKVATTENFYAMVGASRQPVIAFSQFFPEEMGGVSELYLSNIENLTTATPVVTTYEDTNFLALKPLSVEVKDEVIQGVWYTKEVWGTGGDIGFPIQRGIYFYDHQTGKVKEHLNDENQLLGLSPSHSLTASKETQEDGTPVLVIVNLISGKISSIPTHASSDSESGYATFTPDDNLLAWLEASGSRLTGTPDFHSRIRVAQTTPQINLLMDVEDEVIAQDLGYDDIIFIKPIGWLDTQNILIEVHSEKKEDISLVKLNVTNSEINQLGIGNFLAFVYR